MRMLLPFALLPLAALLLGQAAPPPPGNAPLPPGPATIQGAVEGKAKPFSWPKDSTFEFAIKDTANRRIATAYYRVLKELSQGQTVYRLKYVGRNEQISESSECWIHADTMLPLRSTRKVVSGGRTFYLDVAYGKNQIILRRKYEGQQVSEVRLPAPGPVYDYESLVWLIPQLDFTAGPKLKLNVFSTLTEALSTVIVETKGPEQVVVNGKPFQAQRYEFQVSLSQYVYHSVLQDGRAVPALVVMGENTFENLKLDPAKAKIKAQPVKDPAVKQPAEKPKDKPQDKPKDTPKDGENPLGPPPKGSRF
jgi:hypothetical protein